MLVGLVNAGLTSASCLFPGGLWCTADLLHCLDTGCCGPGCSDLKQTPEGAHRGLLDSPEHTDSSQPASRKPLMPLAGPGDMELPPRLIWIWKRRDLRAPAGGLRTGTQAPCHRSKLCCELPDCLWEHTRSPALPGDRVQWLRLFRSQSRHLKAPAGACWIHQSTLTPPSWPPGSPIFLSDQLLQDDEEHGKMNRFHDFGSTVILLCL